VRRRVRRDLTVSPPDAYELAEARGYGLTASDLRHWHPLSAIEIHWARKHVLSPDAARRWAREGVGVRDAVRAVKLCMRPEQVRPWAEAGFLPGDAVEAAEAGMTLAEATAWRQAGFILPDAALLVRDGWTLDEAAVARSAGVDRYAQPAASRTSDVPAAALARLTAGSAMM
jgi:hypothetical protein